MLRNVVEHIVAAWTVLRMATVGLVFLRSAWRSWGRSRSAPMVLLAAFTALVASV